MAMYAVGVKPVDENYLVMAELYYMCVRVGAEIPQKVLDFFGENPPAETEIVSELVGREAKVVNGVNVLEIKVSDIPSDIKIIRFFVG
jgi:hypothetical protein